MNTPNNPASPEEQMLKGHLHISPLSVEAADQPKLATIYCQELLGQPLVPADGDEGASWMTGDSSWLFTETNQPVITNGISGPRDTGRKLWSIETMVHYSATREEPEGWDMVEVAKVDGLEAAVIKAAELTALEAIKQKAAARYEAYAAEQDEALEKEDEDEPERKEPDDDRFADGDALASAGRGTDEDYEHPGSDFEP